ncbi:hypothetical protein ACFQ51_44970 [Streptomyces kaempferi]
MANAGVVYATGDAAPDTWRRLVAYMLRSYAATGSALRYPTHPRRPRCIARWCASAARHVLTSGCTRCERAEDQAPAPAIVPQRSTPRHDQGSRGMRPGGRWGVSG